MKLNVGCGRDVRAGWVNLNDRPGDGVDIVADIGNLLRQRDMTYNDVWTYEYADAFDEIECSHVLEHIPNLLHAAENLWLVAKPGCRLLVRCPHGATDDAHEDPTHVHRLFPGSFGYWGQPNYWRADYGYRGDWRCDKVTLIVAPHVAQMTAAEASVAVATQRNAVTEMVAELVAVKPARPPQKELRNRPELVLIRPT